MSLEKSSADIKVVFSDLEGVLLHSENNDEKNKLINLLSEFSHDLKKLNIEFAIVTGRKSDKLIDSLREKNIYVLYSSMNKVADAETLLNKLGFTFSQILFIGDDILDIPLLQKAGKSAAPKNARREVKRNVNIVFKTDDTTEILREIIKLI